jgi:SPP1 gp7 family putative phage head morphogenesis protein
LEVEEILDDHVLKMLLDRPHPNLTRSQLLRLLAQWIVTVGEGYWLKVSNGLGLPAELHPAPPGQMFPLVANNVVTGYVATSGSGSRTTLPADTVCRFYFPDPENPWASEGYLGPEGVTADSLKFAGQHLRQHFEHDATPKMALESGAEAGAFGTVEAKRFEHEWIKKYHRRVGNYYGTPAILPIGYKLQQMSTQSGADIVPLLEFWRDEQLMGFGTPRSVLGQVVSGDRSSAETNQYVFDRHAVLPIANLIADGLTMQLAHDFDPNLIVCFEDFVSADKEHELNKETADLVNKVRSINQVRQDRGLDEVDWGDQPVATIGQQPYDPEGFMEFTPDTPGALGEDEEAAEEEPRILPGVQRKRRRDFFTPQNEWQRQIAREKKYVPSFTRAQRTIFRDQQRAVLKALREQEPRARAITVSDLFDPAAWDRIFEIRVEPIRQAAFKTTLRETLTGLGAEEAFVFTDEMQKALDKQGAQLVKNVQKTTKRGITKALRAGISEGEGIDELAKRVEGVFRVRRHQARTIARTEVLKSSQSAQLEGFDSSGVVERKEWNTNEDSEVRDSHAYANGQIVDLHGTFDLAGEAADAPGIGAGGSTLSARNSINCRCFLTPVLEEE